MVIIWQIICGVIIIGAIIFFSLNVLGSIAWYFKANAGLIIKIPLFIVALLAIIDSGFITYGLLTGIFWDYSEGSTYFRFWPLFLIPILGPIGYFVLNLPGIAFFLGIPAIWVEWDNNFFIKILVCAIIIALLFGLQTVLFMWMSTWPILK